MKGQAKIDEMLAYINDKYPEDHFAYVSVSGGHLGSNVTKIIVSSEKYPNESIRVIRTELEDGVTFADTYLHIKFAEQTREYIQNALAAEYGENIYVKYIPADVATVDGCTNETTFEEYLANEKTFISFSAMVCAEAADEEAELEKIKLMFANAVLSCNIYYAGKDVDIPTQAQQCINDGSYIKKLYFLKKTLDQYGTVEWVAGK